MVTTVFEPAKDASIENLQTRTPVNVKDKMKEAPVSVVCLSRHIGEHPLRPSISLSESLTQSLKPYSFPLFPSHSAG